MFHKSSKAINTLHHLPHTGSGKASPCPACNGIVDHLPIDHARPFARVGKHSHSPVPRFRRRRESKGDRGHLRGVNGRLSHKSERTGARDFLLQPGLVPDRKIRGIHRRNSGLHSSLQQPRARRGQQLPTSVSPNIRRIIPGTEHGECRTGTQNRHCICQPHGAFDQWAQ